MLLDDARRYVAKAQAADSPVVLQTWPDMIHVWQMFTPELVEAEDAFANVAEFLAGTGALEVPPPAAAADVIAAVEPAVEPPVEQKSTAGEADDDVENHPEVEVRDVS
jgi:hypothetical protein